MLNPLTNVSSAVLVGLLFSLFFSINVYLPFFFISLLGAFLVINKYLKESLILFALLFPFNNSMIIRAGVIDVRILQIFWLLILANLFFTGVLKDRDQTLRIKLESYDVYLLLSIIFCFFQMFYADYSILILRETLQWIYLFSIFIILRSAFEDKACFTRFCNGVSIVTLVFILFACYRLIFGTSPIKYMDISLLGGGITFQDEAQTFMTSSKGSSVFSRANSFFWGSVGTANILMIFYFLNSIKQTLTKTILNILVVVILIATASRAGMVIFYFLYLLDAFIERKLLLKLIISFIGLSLFTALFPWMFARLSDISSMDEMSNRFHLAIWTAAIEMFKSNMIVGVGTGHFEHNPILFGNLRMFNLPEGSMTTHNIFLKILAENGILGIFLLILFTFAIFKLIIKDISYYRNPPQRYVLLAFLATSLMNLTMNATMIEAYWILFALLMSIVPSYQNHKHRLSKMDDKSVSE